MLLAALAACGDKPVTPYALPAGAPVALHVTVREDLVGADGVSRRLEIATRGAFREGGDLDLEVVRARLETSAGKGDVEVADTEAPAPARREDATPAARLLEGLRTSKVRIALDPAQGVRSVDGLDRGLDTAVERDASLADVRAGIRVLCSDEAWRRDLAAAGLCAIPRAVREGGTAEREVRVRVPGRGETTLRLAGPVAQDDSGLPAARVTGKLRPDAAFDGEPGPPPPDAIGPVVVGEVEGTATTSYPAAEGPPVMGEWVLVRPFERRLALRTTTTFKLVLR